MKKIYKIGLFILTIIAIGLVMPQNLSMPVEGATQADYNKDSFWAYPWGTSVTHKGVDIFAKKGTNVKSATYAVVLHTADDWVKGGNVVITLGPKWRLHAYLHLDEILVEPGQFVSKSTVLGTVGNTGNAKSTPPHLHYSIGTCIPYPWRYDDDIQGWKKVILLNPIDYLDQ